MEAPLELEHTILNNFFHYFEHKYYQNTTKNGLVCIALKFKGPNIKYKY